MRSKAPFRRSTLLLAVLAALLGAAPSRAASLPRLAGTTTLVTSIGPAASLVTLPRAVTLDLAYPDRWIRLAFPGHYAGVILDDVGRRGSAARTGLFFARLSPSAGCSLDGRCAPVHSLAVRVPGSATYAAPTTPTLTLAAGTYRVYVLGTETPRIQSVRLTLPGLGGSAAIRLTSRVLAGLASYGQSGLNDGTLAAHPEHGLNGWSFTDESWLNGGGPRVTGGGTSVWSLWANSLVAGGVWTSPPAAGMPKLPATVTGCWHVYPKYAPLGDYWWMHPEAHYQRFADPYTPKCTDASHAGSDRSYVLTSEARSAQFEYRSSSPIVAPGRRVGWFVISAVLLDAQ